MSDNRFLLHEETVKISLFPVITDKKIPETCCAMSEKDKLFWLLCIILSVFNNNCVTLNLSIIFITLEEKQDLPHRLDEEFMMGKPLWMILQPGALPKTTNGLY